jgi:hypothetical protein
MFRSTAVLLRRLAVPALAALMLAACASADVSVINKASDAAIRNVRVKDIAVTVNTAKPNPALKAALEQQLSENLAKCAKGTADHRMDVTINDFEEANIGQAIMIGDEIELEGRVLLTDLATNQPTGEYYVQRKFFWGGLLGAAMMSDPEASLSKGFAESVCKEVFDAS